MKKKILFILIFVFMLFLCDKYSIKANAVRKDDFEIYIETGPALEKKKVYLTDELAFFLSNSKIEILDEPETKWGKTIHHYYYMASRYIDEIVYSRKIDDSMDSLVYMVKQLEFYAADYKLDHNTSSTINDLVLGYLRCINTEYLDASSLFDGLQRLGYKVLCNTYEQEFIDYVRIAEEKKKKMFSVTITIPEYFGRFVDYGFINQSYGVETANGESIVEPIEKLEIDVSHFFAVIDTTRHINRDFPVMLGFHLASWLGDLHQATFKRNVDALKRMKINFKADVLETMDSKFKTNDFMADVDGYNIGFNLLNNTKNNELKVSD